MKPTNQGKLLQGNVSYIGISNNAVSVHEEAFIICTIEASKELSYVPTLSAQIVEWVSVVEPSIYMFVMDNTLYVKGTFIKSPNTITIHKLCE